MDFLSACITNVHTVDSVANISCEAFTFQESTNDTERNSRAYKVVRDLRGQNVLSSYHQTVLYVFGSQPDDIKTMLRNSGVVTAEAIEQEKHTALLDAIEGSLACKLEPKGLTHIAPWTWLFSGGLDTTSNSEGVVVELQAKLGSTGALYITSTVETADWLPIHECSNSDSARDVLLAPSGRLAKLSTTALAGGPVMGYTAWKASVTEILQIDGFELDDDEQWIEIELDHEGNQTTFLWPSRSCFTRSTSRASDAPASRVYWRKWFLNTSATNDAYRDPLAAAEAWFTGAAQRNSTRRADAPALSTESTGVPTQLDATADLVTSPPFNQRTADQQAAMSGIYPTPPDGLLPGTQGAQAAVASDGSAMAPINESSELLPSEEMEGLRHSISSSHAPEGGFHRSDDDLFGDMGEIDFGGNEVGDADFDYFDEPDEEPVANVQRAGEVSADVEMPDTHPQHASGEIEQTAVDPAVAYEPPETLATDSLDQGEAVEPNEQAFSADAITQNEFVANDTSSPEFAHPKKGERPLSPFGIRERLLPPPIPASTVKAEHERKGAVRRSSAFGPVAFNEGLGLAAKYSSERMLGAHGSTANDRTGNAYCPPPQRRQALTEQPESEESDEESATSPDASTESETSVSGTDKPYKPLWQSKKRKRSGNEETDSAAYEQALAWMQAAVDGRNSNDAISAAKLDALRTMLLFPACSRSGQWRADSAISRRYSTPPKGTQKPDAERDDDDLLPVDQLFEHEMDDTDLIYVAQLIAEQSASVIPHLLKAVRSNAVSVPSEPVVSALLPLFDQALRALLPTSTACDLTKLALPRDMNRQAPSQSQSQSQPQSQSGKGPHPVQRSLQRSDSVQSGPDCSPIPPPYIRVQRYGDTVEMLPPALHFWSTLGLSPANGAKDVRVVSLVPCNANADNDLALAVQDFLHELQLVYEANKLGSWKPFAGLHVEDIDDEQELIFENEATVLVHSSTNEEALDSADIIQAFEISCAALGRALALVGHEDSDRTILVCIFSPFHSTRAQQSLCACFWLLYKAYRDNVPKEQRTAQRSDIVLRIIPCELVASPDRLVLLDQPQYGQLAMEIYDRCPPSSKAAAASKDIPSALMPYFSAPAVELAMPIPRRISFQLTAEPPGDLLYENSVLHLAYTISADGEWMCFSWTDLSGRFKSDMSACLRGKSIAEVVGDVWERTLEWLKGRDVTWRVYVVACGGHEGDREGEASVRSCWKEIAGRKARKSALHVSFLEAEVGGEVKLLPPAPCSAGGAGAAAGVNKTSQQPQQGFLTPATTPSASSLTVSPDASAAAATAPPTPAPSDPCAENDTDAHLIDVADESWGLILSPSFISSFSSPVPLASGMLFRRGSASFSTTNTALESLTVAMHWDIRIRPNGTVDGAPPRQAEIMMREVLKLYRHLALLGRVRGLSGTGADEGVVPAHVISVLAAAKAVKGMLG